MCIEATPSGKKLHARIEQDLVDKMKELLKSFDPDVRQAITRLVAVNKETGELLWKHDLVKAFRMRLPSYGYASSPLVVDDRLATEVGGKKTAYIAFDKKNSRIIWASKGDSLVYCSPLNISINGVEQIVFWSASTLHLGRSNGKKGDSGETP